MFDYRLTVFRHVAEQQSLTQAARVLHISQPAVTQHIRILEETFKTALFDRFSTGVSLSEAGIVLLEHVQKTEALHEQVRQKILAGRGALEGHIRVGSSTTVTQYFLPGVLVALKKKHPAVTVEVIEGNSDFIISSVLGRRVDLGLIESSIRRRDLRVQSFYQDEIIVVASPTNRRSRISRAELKKQPLIFRELGSGTRSSVESALQKIGLVVKDLVIVQELPSTEAIKRVVAGGMGIGFLSRLSIAGELKAGTLVELKVSGLSIRRSFSAILPLGPDPVGLRQLVLGFLEDGSNLR